MSKMISISKAAPHFAGRIVIGKESDGVQPVKGLVITWWHKTTSREKFPTLTARWWCPEVRWSW